MGYFESTASVVSFECLHVQNLPPTGLVRPDPDVNAYVVQTSKAIDTVKEHKRLPRWQFNIRTGSRRIWKWLRKALRTQFSDQNYPTIGEEIPIPMTGKSDQIKSRHKIRNFIDPVFRWIERGWWLAGGSRTPRCPTPFFSLKRETTIRPSWLVGPWMNATAIQILPNVKEKLPQNI